MLFDVRADERMVEMSIKMDPIRDDVPILRPKGRGHL